MKRSEHRVLAMRVIHATHAVFVTLTTLALIAVTALAGCGVAPATGAQSAPSPTPTAPTVHYVAALSPLNASGVSATAHLDLSGNVLVITLHASGLEPNREHYLHLHGYPGTMVTCPAGSGGVISVTEGLAHVGPVVLDLQPYPQVTRSGAVGWSHTYVLSPDELANLTPLTDHVVVLHGLITDGVYNRATFVACGQIQAV